MEIVYLILMFLGPGLAINEYERKLKTIGKQIGRSGTIYEQLFGMCIHSVIVTFITLVSIRLIHIALKASFPTTLSGVLLELNDLKQLAAYAITCVIVTIIWYKIYKQMISVAIFDFYKKKLAKDKGVIVEDIDEPTVWENIFFTRDENEKRKIVSVFKDGNYITSGELAGWNTNADERRELRIFNSHIIEEVLKSDKEKEDVSQRLLYNVEYEYYDVENGILIRFYDPKKIDEHWDEL